MAFDKRYYEKAAEVLSRRRAENKELEDKRRMEIYAKIPEYPKAETELAQTMINMTAAALNKSADKEIIKEQAQKNRAIQEKMRRLLIDSGYPEDYMDEIHTCERCRDTGQFEGRWCDCFKKTLNALAAEELNSHSPLKLCTFGDFRLDFYPDDKTGAKFKTEPRRLMENNLRICKEFAENFSGTGSGILMTGATGLGKTHLSLAIANEVVKKGFCVIYGSVTEFIGKIRQEQFSNSAYESSDDTMRLLCDCDLLILDDLGAENSSDYTTSLLYEIINTRQNRNIPMIINTNFTGEKLKERYNDRVYSRLFSMNVLLFDGKDNRLR